ncbi:MAG: oxidoreductase [Marmoricola sp.]|nr:oxidoreductase [Marmoricola sp.]
MDAIQVAVVGLGWWGQNIIGQVAQSELLSVRTGVDPDAAGRARAEALGVPTTAGFASALEDPAIDAVILCSPHRMHSYQVVAAARAGKHVFCEKPFSTSSVDSDRALEAVTKAGVRLGIGHERRFESAVVEMRERLDSGDLGVPLVFEGTFSQDKFLALPSDNWRLSSEHAPVGPLSATGIHLVDLAIAMMGSPTQVWAQLSTRATSFENGDNLTITMTFADGGTAVITAVLTTPFIGRVCVMGSQGWMEIRDRSHPESPTGWDVTTTHRDGSPELRFFEPEPAVLINLEAFARSVMGKAEYPVTLGEIRSNVRAFEAITRSALTGQVETV